MNEQRINSREIQLPAGRRSGRPQPGRSRLHALPRLEWQCDTTGFAGTFVSPSAPGSDLRRSRVPWITHPLRRPGRRRRLRPFPVLQAEDAAHVRRRCHPPGKPSALTPKSNSIAIGLNFGFPFSSAQRLAALIGVEPPNRTTLESRIVGDLPSPARRPGGLPKDIREGLSH